MRHLGKLGVEFRKHFSHGNLVGSRRQRHVVPPFRRDRRHLQRTTLLLSVRLSSAERLASAVPQSHWPLVSAPPDARSKVRLASFSTEPAAFTWYLTPPCPRCNPRPPAGRDLIATVQRAWARRLHSLRRWHHARVLPDGSNGFRKIEKA